MKPEQSMSAGEILSAATTASRDERCRAYAHGMTHHATVEKPVPARGDELLVPTERGELQRTQVLEVVGEPLTLSGVFGVWCLTTYGDLFVRIA